ncbi:hypothetical protein EV183_000069 [Coemansia sp. RSA 2336]|nr:hypothetical protein EV183_000297 [Coemansia sp. RSA 2336]KAJ2456416.1 hypothetical protein EV183_000069 [Coemansia sp. RSA 2336]
MSEGAKYATARNSAATLAEQEEMETSLLDVDELTRQGLLDGLEDLYDYSPETERSSVQIQTAANIDSIDSGSMADGNTEVEELDDMDPAEAANLVSQFGAFKPARASVDCTEAAGTQSSSSSSSTQQDQMRPTQGNTEEGHSKAEIDQLPDMSEIEAKQLVMSFGGFSRAPKADQKAPEEGKTAQKQQTGRAVLQRKTEPSRPSQPRESQKEIQQPTGNATSPFPSRRDVLSARRALMEKSRGQSPAFASPRRITATRPAAALQPPPAGESPQAAAVGGARRQLSFRQPGRKRISSGLQFKSPAKRVAAAEMPQQKPKSVAKADTKAVRDRGLGAVGMLLDVGSRRQVPQPAKDMTADQAATYRFPKGASGWGAAEAAQELRAQGRDVADAWVRNHYRWVVWTSASYARRIPTRWREFWSTEYVLQRLARRHERESVRGERPALRQVLERDEVAQRAMVLCVAQVGAEIEVTDGWYSMRACTDAVLQAAITRGQLRAGDKIACAGLRMESSEACEPLSPTAQSARLLLNANSVRRARWDAVLGFQPHGALFLSLGAVHACGGPVGATLDVVVMRRYPTVYSEVLPSGGRIVRTAREEERIAIEDAERRTETPHAPDALPPSTRNVAALFHMRVCDYPAHAGWASSRSALVTVWRAQGFDPSEPREGTRLLITGASVAPAATPGVLKLSVGSSSWVRPARADPQVVARSTFRPRQALRVDELRSMGIGCEVDVVGHVVDHRHGHGVELSAVRLQSVAGGHEFLAEIEYASATFGRVGAAPGASVTVRSCSLVGKSSEHSFRLRADELSQFN